MPSNDFLSCPVEHLVEVMTKLDPLLPRRWAPSREDRNN